MISLNQIIVNCFRNTDYTNRTLNLALDATSEEREKSLELEVGYQPLDQEWDLIIKYSGNLEAVREIASSVTELSNEYAILTVPESRIEQLTRVPDVYKRQVTTFLGVSTNCHTPLSI